MLALSGWLTSWLLWRAKCRVDEAMQHFRRESARLQLRVQTLERRGPEVSAGEPPATSGVGDDYFAQAISDCESKLATLTRSDAQYLTLQWRLRALTSEKLARDSQLSGDDALTLVLPSYTPPNGQRAVVASKDAQLLKQRLDHAEIEIARLKSIEALYHDLRSAVSGHATRGAQLTEQLHNDWQARGADDTSLSLLKTLQASYAEMQKLMHKADSHTPLHLPPELKLALEHGAKLQAALLHDQASITELRSQIDIRPTDDIEQKEIVDLRAQVKSQHNQLREAMTCIDTLEGNLSEAQLLLKKLVERARRYQDQDSRVAILEARCKQSDKDLRMVTQINAQIDQRCKELNKQIEALHQGGEPALQQAQQRVNAKEQEMSRALSEKAMLEEQVIELDQWRDRAEQAEAQLRRALDEKQMIEDELISLQRFVDVDSENDS